MEERFAVTAVTGALGPVMVKLTALLGDEYKLQEGARRDIMSIKSELEPVHDFMWKLWVSEDLDVSCKDWMTEIQKLWVREDLHMSCKDWMTEVRELSYDMEDDIDRFITHGLERGDSGCFIQLETMDSPFTEFIQGVVNGVSNLYHMMMQTIPEAIIRKRRKPTTDPRALFLHKDASDLVGMEKKEELIQLLQEHEMVCIIGFAGMGKTTLANLVYHTIGDQFQCRAFVSVHPSPIMMEVLGTILSQVTNGATTSASSAIEPASEQNFINDISISLSDKRYLIIIDDVWDWEDWEVIRKALPKNNMGSKIVMTTRNKTIAEKCQTEQGAQVYTQYLSFQDAERLSDRRLGKSIIGDTEGLSTNIAFMAQATPLAVICLSEWAESHVQATYGEWCAWVTLLLMDKFLSTPSLEPLVRSVWLGLPVQLKICLLYCSLYPLNHAIERDCLVRKWIAEGLMSQLEAAEAYFEKLVSSNFLWPEGGNRWSVDYLVQCFLVCKAKQDNFAACRQYNGPCSSSRSFHLRRLCLYKAQCPDEDVSHTRTLVVVSTFRGQQDGVPLNKFRNLRVLELQSCSDLESGHLEDICGLIGLRYLGLRGCLGITELPQNIGELKNLEILDVRSTCISKLPVQIEKLQRLKILDACNIRITEVPEEIGRLQHLVTLNISGTGVTELPREITELQRLENLDVSWTGVRELPKEIGKLQHLRILDIRGTKVRELSCRQVPNSFLHVVGYADFGSGQVLVKLPLTGDEDIVSSPQVECRKDLSILVLFNNLGRRCQVLPVLMFRVAGRHVNIPAWVRQDLSNVSLDLRLCKFVEDDLEFLQGMPNLQALALRFEVLPREPINITGEGFSNLGTFYVDCRLPRVTFELGAMPKLKHLEFKFYTGRASQDDGYSMGIMHLPSLDKVVFRCSEYYTSDGPGISAMIEVVRREAVQHPNEITLWVNDVVEPEVFGSSARWISQADKAIIQKETAERERIQERRFRLSIAAEWRAQQYKDNVTSGGICS